MTVIDDFIFGKYKIRRRNRITIMITSDNIILATLSRLITARFVAIGSLYGITTWSTTANKIKLAIWNSFAKSLTLC